MISDLDIVCLAHLPWEGPWKAYHQLVSRVAETNRIVCVDPPAGLRSFISAPRHRDGMARGGGPIADAVTVYRPPWWLGRTRFRSLERLAQPLRMAHTARALRRAGFTTPVLWVFEPWLAPHVERFHPRLVIYHVVDDYLEYLHPSAARRRTMLQRLHESLLRRADLVFAVSESLRDKCRLLNPATYLVPNGVDFDRFQRAAADPYVPFDIAALPRPIIGYVGVIEPHFDVPLLEGVAAAHPEWSIVVVGPAYPGPRVALTGVARRRPNVHVLGAKPPGEVPHYVKSLDVALLVDHERTDGDTIKLYEYLACGRPVVSINPKSVERAGALVSFAPDREQFVRRVEEALTEDAGAAAARLAFAREQTWQQRADLVRAMLAHSLSKAGSVASTGVTPAHPRAPLGTLR